MKLLYPSFFMWNDQNLGDVILALVLVWPWDSRFERKELLVSFLVRGIEKVKQKDFTRSILQIPFLTLSESLSSSLMSC